LNLIKHVWDILDRQIERKRLSIKNLQQLKVVPREEWARLDDEFVERLVRSMKRRCEEVIKAKGGVADYLKKILWIYFENKHLNLSFLKT
jgi:hypothetical protein